MPSISDPIIVNRKKGQVKGPLRDLELNKYATDEILMYPLDLTANDESYRHILKININLPERSKYNAILTTLQGEGSFSVADKNRAMTEQLGSSPDPIGAGGSFGAAFGGIVGAMNIAKAKSTYDVAGALTRAGIAGAIGTVGVNSVDMTRKTKRLLQTILLHVPDTVNETSAYSWDKVSLTDAMGTAGFAATAASAAGASFSSLFDGEDSVANELKSKLGAGKQVTGTNAVFAEMGGKIGEKTGAFGSGFEKVMMASFGMAKNPQVEILFNSPSNRDFTFEIKLIPRSQKEAIAVLNIIKTLKFHAAPELVKNGGGRYWIPPSEFDITYMYAGLENKALNRLSTCVLTGFDVNYSSAGHFATFDDGIPVEFAMTLRFTEVELLHKDLVKDGF